MKAYKPRNNSRYEFTYFAMDFVLRVPSPSPSLHFAFGLVLRDEPIKSVILQEGPGLCWVNRAERHLRSGLA